MSEKFDPINDFRTIIDSLRNVIITSKEHDRDIETLTEFVGRLVGVVEDLKEEKRLLESRLDQVETDIRILDNTVHYLQPGGGD